MSFTNGFEGRMDGMEPQAVNNGESAAGVSAAGQGPDPGAHPGKDAELERVLTDFRRSVHAWSDAVYSRPRVLVAPARQQRSWRKAGAWTLGCLLAAGAASGGIYERRHRAELAQVAAMREAEHQRQLAAERAREAEDLLARVDSDVSREVPDALEPLAQLMDDQNQ